MRILVSVSIAFLSFNLFAQAPNGIWHGKLYDTNGNSVKYISLSFKTTNNKTSCQLASYIEEKDNWQTTAVAHSSYVQVNQNGVFTYIKDSLDKIETNVMLLHWQNNKRMTIDWVHNKNFKNSTSNIELQHAHGFLEPFLGGKIYENLSIGGSSTNRISIDKVEIADTVTVVTFSYHNTSFDEVLMQLAKPGSQGAYYITPPNRSKKYHIVDKDNITFAPDNTVVPANSFHTFKIYFEALPDSLTNFSILEGDPKQQSGQEWNFYDIQLK